MSNPLRLRPPRPVRVAAPITAAAVAAIAVALACPTAARAQAAYFDPAHTYRVPVGDGVVRGPADAPVTIVEFSDFLCGYCKRAQATLAALRRRYGSAIRIVYRNDPLDPEDGTLPSEAALAALAQGRFWAMHDRLFAARKMPTRAALDRYAREIGLDLTRFRRALDARRYRSEVLADWREARDLGITGAPMFFVNGRPVVGAQPLSVFVPLVDAELAHARRLIAAGTPRSKVYATIIKSGAASADSAQDLAGQVRRRRLDPDKVYPVRLGPPSYRRGPDDALVTVVEFSDFQCPYCGRAEPTVERLRRVYGRDLRVVFRNFPLSFHPHAELAAEAAVAAARQGKFWPFHDLLYRHQDALTRADLLRYARRLGLDMAKFRAALETRRYWRVVHADAVAGAVLGVSGTPTFFVNGTPVVGAVPFSELAALVDAKKAAAEALVKKGVPPARVYAKVTGARAAVAPPAKGAAQRPAKGAAQRPAKGAAAAPAHTPPLVFGDADFQLATLLACKAGNPRRARLFYGKLKGRARRRIVRKDCRKLGVVLPR